MPKRKKYPRLPNGYGSIRYLGKKRRNPYAVHPPVTEFDIDGNAQRPKALCYVDDWYKGFAVLTAYKAGNYIPGMENGLKIDSDAALGDISGRILADYNRSKGTAVEENAPTFAEVYAEFFKWKYEGEKKYSEASWRATQVAYGNCSALYNRVFKELRYDDLQNVVDSCPLKHASLELIVSLFHQMYKYADIQEYVDKDYSKHVTIKKADDDEHGVPFSEKELKFLWEHQNDRVAEFLLIMCYSGFRISEYKSMEVNLKEGYFKGGIKTRAGKNRIVPIHSSIYPLVKKRMRRDKCILETSTATFRTELKSYISQHRELSDHTPHDCRHTFSYLCEKYKVHENDRKRMLGHAFDDITNSVYGHRDIEGLKIEIEKIQKPID